MLGSKQTETEQGKQFLETATMADMCKVSIYIIILEMATMADMCNVSAYVYILSLRRQPCLICVGRVSFI